MYAKHGVAGMIICNVHSYVSTECSILANIRSWPWGKAVPYYMILLQGAMMYPEVYNSYMCRKECCD
jgi:hypothetical protein